MEIILGKTAGFCGGVRNAVKNTEMALEQYGNIYCLGELVHNKEVINKLEKKGLVIIDKIQEENEKVIIRAHGTTKDIYEKAKELNIELLDYTCKKVSLIHDLVEEYVNKEYYIVLIGEEGHPETIGTFSFCGDYKSNITKIEDVDIVVKDIEKSGKKNVLIVSQTTFNTFKFDEIVEKMKNILNKDIELKVEKTICNATMLRQEETVELAKQVDMMIIIGGKNSANTNKLYDISKKYCNNSVIIQTYEDLEKDLIKNAEKIGIMAGASTPKESIDEVINYIKLNNI